MKKVNFLKKLISFHIWKSFKRDCIETPEEYRIRGNNVVTVLIFNNFYFSFTIPFREKYVKPY